MSAMIELKYITKYFGRRSALDNVSLRADEGEVVALLGDNGAGKTTALKILLGLVEPDQGQARVLGLDSEIHGRQIRQRIGFVPEQPVLYEWMTVDEIGWFTAGLSPKGFLPSYRKLAAEFNLPPRTKIQNLSKGMKAKVSLALALAHEPQVLILDEPTSGLDVLVRREFLQRMVDVASTGRTVLLSSHQIGEVERVADKVAILRQGRLLAYEPLDTLKVEVREITVTGGKTQGFTWPGELLTAEHKPHQSRYVLRATAESDLAEFARAEGAEFVEIRPLDLEAIFVAYLMQQRSPSPAGSLVS